jgi:toxin-antitoxin system PIN domain toxin
MRTTLSLDDDVIELVRSYAENRSLAIGKAVSELVRRGLAAPVKTRAVNGLVVFDVPKGTETVTSEHVKRATCPMTESGFVRIVSNPAFSRRPVSPRDALEVLRGSLQHRTHRFWPEDIGIAEAVSEFVPRLVGHRQVTDAYLLGLAIHKKGKLVTLDRGLESLLQDRDAAKDRLVLL